MTYLRALRFALPLAALAGCYVPEAYEVAVEVGDDLVSASFSGKMAAVTYLLAASENKAPADAQAEAEQARVMADYAAQLTALDPGASFGYADLGAGWAQVDFALSTPLPAPGETKDVIGLFGFTGGAGDWALEVTTHPIEPETEGPGLKKLGVEAAGRFCVTTAREVVESNATEQADGRSCWDLVATDGTRVLLRLR